MTRPDRPSVAQQIELEIESLAFGGRGLARLNGFVIFVEGALPGDRVLAEIIRSTRSFAEARTVAVISPSQARIEPECRHFGVCGGCSWQTLEYQTQLKFKQRQVDDCLSRIGGVDEYEIDTPLGASQIWRYRNKVEYSFTGDEGGLKLGFHLPGDWRRVMDVEDCLLHSETTNRMRDFIREFASQSGAGAYDQRSGKGFWRHLVLREAFRTGEFMVNIVTAPGEFPAARRFVNEITSTFPGIASLLWSVNGGRSSVAAGFPYHVLAGRDHIFEEIGGLKLEVSPSSFMQTNTGMAERLYGKSLEYGAPGAGDLVFDLYSGIGSIALSFARHCREVVGIEIVEEAVRAAAANARLNNIENASFRYGKVRSVLKEILAAGRVRQEYGSGPVELVILDPPRAGASKKEIQRILELDPDRIVYVSCNAATMAANASRLKEGGYRLVKAGSVDMFPHTPHIEVVASFKK
ncbi:MAG: 23S rRNA (uracil(1939)-C(5))-methyltransferase RlmD [Actinobacteria bacterium]|nr:23S rRNA (uracil(1939)-C(5))-methyltransferase RlmD [Actinomycetota bacterium]